MAMQQKLEQLHEELAALRVCLADSGVVQESTFQVQLHRQRFQAAKSRSQWVPDADASLPAAIQLKDFCAGVHSCAGTQAAILLSVTYKGSLAASRYHNAYVYVFGGKTSEQTLSSSEVFCPINQKWEVIPHTVPIQTWSSSAAVMQGYIYMCGVDALTGAGEVLRFDPLAQGEAWETLTCGQHACTPRVQTTVCVLGDWLYLCGGSVSNSKLASSSAERLKPGDVGSWEVLPNMQESRNGAAATTFEGQVLVSGGWENTYPQDIKASVELYDPTSRKWRIAPPMQIKRERHCCVAANQSVYACGGFGGVRSAHALHISEVLQPAADAWVALPRMSVPRGAAACGVVRGKIYICGGLSSSGETLNSAECFDIRSCQWKASPSLAAPRAHHSAAVVILGS